MKDDFKLNEQLVNDCDFICSLQLCDVLLSKENIGPWLIIVPRVANLTEIFQLSEAQQQQLLKESQLVSQILVKYFNAEKINIAAIGNMVSQLHIHHVARFKSDYLWPKPIWGNTNQVQREQIEQNLMIQKLQTLTIGNF